MTDRASVQFSDPERPSRKSTWEDRQKRPKTRTLRPIRRNRMTTISETLNLPFERRGGVNFKNFKCSLPLDNVTVRQFHARDHSEIYLNEKSYSYGRRRVEIVAENFTYRDSCVISINPLQALSGELWRPNHAESATTLKFFKD